jgi:tRNA modification GTPase
VRGRCSTDREDVHPRAADGRAADPDAAAQEPWAALLTPPGRGALAVVGIAGTGAVAVVERLFAARGGRPLVDRDPGSIAFGTWRPTGEDVVVTLAEGGRVEVHGHGGFAAAEGVLASLDAVGVRRGTWREWTALTVRGPAAREALLLLPRAGGPAAARMLARQAAGLLDREFERIDAARAAGDHAAARRMAERLLAAARVGLRLVQPWRVVLAGDVNAGKSSLMNAIVGHGRSIVSSVPGTTRDVVTARTVLDGWEFDLVDVAGTRADATSAVERAGIAGALAARESADLVLRVVPADALPSEGATPGPNELVVVTKADLVPGVSLAGAVVTSAVTNAGLDTLVATIVDHLVPEARRDPDLLAVPVPFTPRQVAAIEALCRD